MGEDKRESPGSYDNSFKEISFFDKKLIFRQPKFHRISVDLVIFLSKLKGIKRKSRVIDLGAGFGFLSITVAKLYKSRVIAVERDPFLYELLEYNINVNGLSTLVTPIKGDIRNISDFVRKGEFDVCIMNPPFHKGISGNIAHFEEDTTLEHFIKASSYSLRDGGYINIFFIPTRIYELFNLMRDSNVHPFYMCLLFPREDKKPKRVIISGRKNLKGLMEIDRAFFINDKDKKYTYQTIDTLKALSAKL